MQEHDEPHLSHDMKGMRNMATSSIEHIPEQPPTALTTQRKAAPWGYFFYCELLKIFRNPPSVVFGIGFPTFFFLIFGNATPAEYASTTLAQYAAYGAFVVAFQTFSISVANERSLGWNKLLRTTSMSPALYLGSKFLVIILTGVISMLVLFVVAVISRNVHMDLVVWAQLLGLMMVGMIPLGLLGLFLGLIGSANLTTALSTTLMLLLSFASGLLIPLPFLPDLVRKIAPYLPTYHLGQLALISVGSPYNPYGRDNQPLWVHLLILLAYGVVFAVLAGWAYIRDENKNFA
jgi:ABC-2 type transport system permease protein